MTEEGGREKGEGSVAYPNPDPSDPYVFGPSGSRSGSISHHAK